LRFWDSSAVVPLLVEQESSPLVAAWLAQDEVLVLWTFTQVEVVSALRRLVREKSLEEKVARLEEGTLGAGLPLSRSSTRCARKSVNGVIFCRTLAASRVVR